MNSYGPHAMGPTSDQADGRRMHINLGLVDQILSPFSRQFYCLNGIACNIFYADFFLFCFVKPAN